MKTRTLLAIPALMALLVAQSGCQFIDKLEARDHLNKGVRAYTAKLYDEAAEEFKTAIDKDPTLRDAYLYLATTYRAEFVPLVRTEDNLRKGQEAIRVFEQVLEMDPQNVNAMANIADIYRNMERPDDAKEWYRRLMELPEQRAQALYGIGSIDYNLANSQTGSDGEGVEEMTEEQRADVGRQVDEGIAALKEALELNPDYSDAMEYLNLLYREKAELAQDDEERRRWQHEADRLALEALDAKRRLQRQAEEERRRVFRGEEKEGGD
jgi:tetratricopeptide (TPR) repeat protein